MSKFFKHFLTGLIIISLIVAGTGYWLFTSVLQDYYLPIFPWVLLFYMLITSVVHYFHLKTQEAADSKFPRYSMAVNAIKIFLFLIFIIAYVFLRRESAVPFLFGFFALYMIYSAYELLMLRKAMEKKKK